MQPTFTRTQAIINSTALKHNLQRVKSYAPNSKILAMIKANGYGHGLINTARALNEADAFGVHCLQEAMVLRDAGIKSRIVLMVGFIDPDELPIIAKQNIDIVIHDQEQLSVLFNAKLKKPVRVWLKCDTGMHRLGFAPDKIKQTYQQLMADKNVAEEIIVMTHFAKADQQDKDYMQLQINAFDRIDCNTQKSLSNSAAIIDWPETHKDWVRPGIMLYGSSPFMDSVGLEHDLQPVMTLKSKIIAIHDLQKGEIIGYGGTYTAPETMRIGVIAIGYGDGYPRHAENGTPVLINNMCCPLVGRVSMDMITVDLRRCKSAKIGDEVTLWGEGLPIEIIAKHSSTISYELMCSVAMRVEFVWIAG